MVDLARKIDLDDGIKYSAAKDHFDKLFKGKKVKRILFFNPPDVDEDIFDYNIAKRGRANNYPSYGLGILTTQLINKNYEVDVCNLNHEILKKIYYHNEIDKESFKFVDTWNDILNKKIEEFNPDIIGVSCLFSVTHNSFKKVCSYIKKNYPNIPLLIGGVHVSHDIYGVINDLEGVDLVSLFEGDRALPNLLEVINGEKKVEDLAQFAFKSGKDIFIFDERMVPNSEDMSIIPAYNKMDLKNHSKFGTIGSWHGMLGDDIVVSTCQSNRGCRAACTFCNVRTYHGKTVRHKTVDAVVDELPCLQNDYGVNHIVWLDDDLLKDKERTIHMFNEMVRRNVKLTWDATNGVIAHSLKQKEVVDAMHKSGCIGLHIGIESGNPQILKQIRKPGTVDTFLNASEILKDYPEINCRALLMLGFPNETLSMIFDTIELAENMNLDWNNLSVLQPWKGTPIYEQMSDEGLLGMEEGTLKTEDNEKAPYQLGTYSRQRAIETGKIESDIDLKNLKGSFLDKLQIANFDTVPKATILDDLWFYMNVRVNFSKLLRENRPIKLKQQYQWLNYVSNKTAPDNAMIIYFYALMQKKYLGNVDEKTKKRLKERLNDSVYWQEKFNMFNLKLEHLESEIFPRYIDNGGIPNNFEGDQSRFYFPKDPIN